MNNGMTGQVIQSAADVYETFFVPALFQEWANQVATVAQLPKGARVLDVACGTGILARNLAERVGASGAVVGLDINEGMLTVAQRQSSAVVWRHGNAEALPFDNDEFSAALSQFGLMFFTDRKQAIQEMARVVEPGGRVVVAVWDRLEKTQGYAKIAELVQQLFGSDAADAIRAPFCLGDRNELQKLFSDQSLTDLQIVTRTGTARFPSIDGWIYTEIKGWTLADYLSDEQFEQLLAEARIALQSYINAQGIVTFTTSAHIVSATVV